jgi:regulator of sigma E protease
MVIYIIMLAAWGEQYLPTANMKYGITVDTLGYQMGLRNGDKILTVDHKYIEDYMDIPKEILLNEAKTVQVIRDGKNLDVMIPKGFISKLIKEKSPYFISVRFPFVIGKFSTGSAAKKAGMQENDQIIGLNDSILPYYDQFRASIQKYKGKEIRVVILRGPDTLRIPVQVSSTGLIGIGGKELSSLFTLRTKSYNLITAIPAGVVKAFNGAGNYLKSIRLLFSQEKAYESVGGFITIGNIFPSTWDWQAFWSLTAFLSIMLAILNVLPIPALDGGFVMFLLFEIIFRRKPGDKFLEYAQIVGMVILFGLLIFANMNDIIKLFR